MAKIAIEENSYLTLVKLNEEAKASIGTLVKTIREIDGDYMEKFGKVDFTICHVALIGPYDFAILYKGSPESATYMAARIAERRVGETLTMPAIDLDRFGGMFSA